MGISEEGLATQASAHERYGTQQFTHAADMAVAARVLFWLKETGDRSRNSTLPSDILAQRKAILEIAHKLVSSHLEQALEDFHQNYSARDSVLAELQDSYGS